MQDDLSEKCTSIRHIDLQFVYELKAPQQVGEMLVSAHNVMMNCTALDPAPHRKLLEMRDVVFEVSIEQAGMCDSPGASNSLLKDKMNVSSICLAAFGKLRSDCDYRIAVQAFFRQSLLRSPALNVSFRTLLARECSQ